MYRGTTPTLVLNVTGCNFSGCSVYVALRQDNHMIIKKGADLNIIPDGDDAQIEVYCSQEETLSFRAGQGLLQIRWIDAAGVACASPIKKVDISPILQEGVIGYAGN